MNQLQPHSMVMILAHHLCHMMRLTFYVVASNNIGEGEFAVIESGHHIGKYLHYNNICCLYSCTVLVKLVTLRQWFPFCQMELLAFK